MILPIWICPWTSTTLLSTFDPRKISWTLICLTIWILFLWNMAGSVRSCCVPNCFKSRSDNVILHSFPDPDKEKERFAAWVKAVGISMSSLSDQHILKNRKICHDHFEEKYLTWTRRLSYGAVPTINMPGLQMPVLRDITNIPISTEVPPTPSTSVADVNYLTNAETTNMSTCATTVKNKRKGAVFMDTDQKTLTNMLKKVTKKKESYARRLRNALNLSRNITFQNLIKKFDSFAAIFLALQVREIKKDKMGRRFTQQEKIMALSLYKQGPKCYKFMRKAFVLPSPLTLSRLIAKAELKAGINEKLFQVMMQKIENLNPDDKLCVLLFDEIAITPHFDYNRRKDIISGFVTNGKTIENKIADHALVFMIRGVMRNYKQPIAYTFCSGSTKKTELAELITEIIRKLHSIGMKVLATVCDQGASNVSSINYLIEKTKQKYLRNNQELRRKVFEIDDNEIIPLYDPPHLIKGIRNNLLDKNLKCTIDGTIKVAKWDHIIKLYEEDPSYSGIRLLKNLTKNHVYPEQCKMKVKFATQIFSHKVASTMGYLAGKNILPNESQETADVLLFFDNLFDSFNGSQENARKRSGKPLLHAVKPNSIHNVIWENAKKVLSTMKFLKNGKEVTVPSVNNWIHTINNAEYLRDILFNKYSIKSIWMRHYNQDPLENFFGAIRSHGYRNISPSPDGFEVAFASLLIRNLTGTHSPGSNCEQDTCSTMFNSMRALFKPRALNNMSQIDLNYMQHLIFVDFELKKNNPRILGQLNFVTGYLLRETKKNIFKNCHGCKINLYNENKDNEYLMAREFNKMKHSLNYPCNNIVEMFSKMQDILSFIVKNYSNSANLRNLAKTILYIEINTSFIDCETHKTKNIEFIFDLACILFIFNWCKDVNNILKGVSREEEDDDLIKNLALEYLKKHRKRK